MGLRGEKRREEKEGWDAWKRGDGVQKDAEAVLLLTSRTVILIKGKGEERRLTLTARPALCLHQQNGCSSLRFSNNCLQI